VNKSSIPVIRLDGPLVGQAVPDEKNNLIVRRINQSQEDQELLLERVEYCEKSLNGGFRQAQPDLRLAACLITANTREINVHSFGQHRLNRSALAPK
jgi:hypothetical protein